jgi:citrate synthase
VSSSAGLRGVVAGASSISSVDGLQGNLTYRGISIHDLAENGTFEEVAYLLWHARLPLRGELEELQQQLRAQAALPEPVLDLLHRFPPSARPMHALRTAVSALSMWDPEGADNSPAANQRKAVRLTAQIPTVIATLNHLRNGRVPVPPRRDLGLAANFLFMLTGEPPGEVAARTFDIALILHADHEFNASTFSARVTIATLSDLHSAITSAIGTLAGPLHGGANEAVFRMLQEIGSVENVEPYLRARLADKSARIMGFGHAVYKTTDPRAKHLKRMARALAEESGNVRLYQVSAKIEERMMAEKQLHANVDFYSATVYHILAIPTDLFTPLFAISRVVGWTAHVLEQLADNRIIRPSAEYVGPVDVPYVPMDARSA